MVPENHGRILPVYPFGPSAFFLGEPLFGGPCFSPRSETFPTNTRSPLPLLPGRGSSHLPFPHLLFLTFPPPSRASLIEHKRGRGLFPPPLPPPESSSHRYTPPPPDFGLLSYPLPRPLSRARPVNRPRFTRMVTFHPFPCWQAPTHHRPFFLLWPPPSSPREE